MDSVKSFFKPTSKTSKNKPPPKPPKKVTFADKKAGYEILKELSRENPPPTIKPTRKKIVRREPKMSQQEINNRVLQIMSGGKIT